MPKVISVFNNKGGVGKTVLAWNIADALARQGQRVLLVDFDPQCNLSLAVLGEETFINKLPNSNLPYKKRFGLFFSFSFRIFPEERFTFIKGRTRTTTSICLPETFGSTCMPTRSQSAAISSQAPALQD